MRAVVALLLCVAVAVSAQPKPGATKGGAPLQAKRASIKPNTVPRASPNQVCTALYGATTVTGTCWTADTCKRHAGQGLTAVTAQAPGNKCPAGQSCCVTGLKPLPPTPTAPVTPPPVKPPTTTPTAPSAPAPVKPPAPQQPPAPQAPQGVPQPQVPAAPQAPAALPKAAGFVDKCAAYTGKPGEKPSRYGCTRCVNSNDNNQLRCRYSTQSGTCYGSGYRYGEAAWAYERLLKERFVEYPGDCDRIPEYPMRAVAILAVCLCVAVAVEAQSHAAVKGGARLQAKVARPQPAAAGAAKAAAKFADPCVKNSGPKNSRVKCMSCVGSTDAFKLRCKFDLKTGSCFGSGTRSGADAWKYQQLLKGPSATALMDCNRI